MSRRPLAATSSIGATTKAVDHAIASSEADSVLEVRFLRLAERSGLPKPEIQYEIRQDGCLVARVDFFFAGVRLVVELDGLGYVMLRFTWHDVVNRPDYVVESTKCALGTEMAK